MSLRKNTLYTSLFTVLMTGSIASYADVTLNAPSSTFYLGMQGPDVTIPVLVSGGTATNILIANLPAGIIPSYSNNGDSETLGCNSVAEGDTCFIQLAPGNGIQASNTTLQISGINTNSVSVPLSVSYPSLSLNPDAVTTPQPTTVDLTSNNGVPAEVTSVALNDSTGVWQLGNASNCADKTLNQDQSCNMILTASNFTNTQASLAISGSNFPTITLPINTTINPGEINIVAPIDPSSKSNITFNETTTNDKIFSITNSTPFTVPLAYTYPSDFGSNSGFQVEPSGCTGTYPNLSLITGSTCTLDLHTNVPSSQDYGQEGNFNLGVASINNNYNLILGGGMNVTLNTTSPYAAYQEVTLTNGIGQGVTASNIQATLASNLNNVAIGAPRGVANDNTCTGTTLSSGQTCTIWFHTITTSPQTISDPAGITLSWQQSNGAEPSVSLGVNASTYLYAGGNFREMNGVKANYIAAWNGQTWQDLNGGLSGGLYSFGVYSLLVDPGTGNLYAGGDFTNCGDQDCLSIASWNGQSWQQVGPGYFGRVNVMAMDSEGNLVVSGDAGSGIDLVFEYNGANWTPIANITSYANNSWINALSFDSSNNLYIGGLFSVGTSMNSNYLAKWDGTNLSLIPGLGNGYQNTPPSVSTILPTADGLYVGGNFCLEGNSAACALAQYDGSSWQDIGNINNSAYTSIDTLTQSQEGQIYAVGYFPQIIGVINGTTVTSIAGSSVTSASETYGTHGLVVDSNGSVYMSGAFDVAGTSNWGIGAYQGSTWQVIGVPSSGNIQGVEFGPLVIGPALQLTLPTQSQALKL